MSSDVSLAERRATLLHAAAKVGHNVTSILDPDELLEKTVDIICDEFGFYYAGVFLIDVDGSGDVGRRWAVLRAGRGEAGAAMMTEGYKLEVNGRSMIGAATGMGSAIIALDVGEEPVHFKNPHLPDTRSEMALPLMVGDSEGDVRIIGALTVQSTEEAAFSDDDITALQAMADQLAIAIHNARLYDQNQQLLAQAERRTRLLGAAARVGRDVASILDLDELLPAMVDVICDAYGFYYAGVFLVEDDPEDPDRRWAVLRVGRGEAGAAMVDEGHKLEVGGHSMIGAAAGMQGALIALDVGEEPDHFKNPHLPDTRSEMALPLVVGGDLIGAVTVQSTEEAAFSDDDITSLQAMADHLAVAIRNAQLLKELEAAHADLLRTKTYEALATATLEAIHWIGNKALPITAGVGRLVEDLNRFPPSSDPGRLASMHEDLEMIAESARLIISVQEHLIGPAREEQPRPALVEDVVKDAAVRLGIPADVIAYEIAPDLPLVRADTTQLGRAFGYLLQNALEAVEEAEEKRIKVGAAPVDDDFVAIQIADTGPGIPEEDVDKIWAAFYTTKGAQHAGLGLSAALRILKQLEGRITAANAPAGEPEGGAVFEVLVPVYDGPFPEAALPSGKKVLLVDDDDAWSRFATAALKKAGNEVVRSADGQVDSTPFDLILMDAVLAHADSRAVLERIVAEGAGDKTLVVASGLRVEGAMQMIQLGAQDVVLKPYTATALAEIVG
jgi:GAF domain-containing protein